MINISGDNNTILNGNNNSLNKKKDGAKGGAPWWKKPTVVAPLVAIFAAVLSPIVDWLLSSGNLPASKIEQNIQGNGNLNIANVENLNIGEKIDRKVPDDIPPEVMTYIEQNQDRSFQILYYQSDAESKRFASKMYSYLTDKGYHIDELIGWQLFKGTGVRIGIIDGNPKIEVFLR